MTAKNVHPLREKIRMRTLFALYSIPPAYQFFARIKYRSKLDRIVHADTELAIGGFPRSANSFATYAFLSSQPRPVKLAHHIHSAGQITAAIHLGIPAIVLIRHPKDAIVSLALRNPRTSIPAAFNNYDLFYRVLLGRPGYIIARFEEVVTNFGAVIACANETFGTSFTPFASSEEDNRKVFEIIEKRHMQLTQKQSVNELMIARPSEAKKQAKSRIEQMLNVEFAEELQKVEALWQEFCSQR